MKFPLTLFVIASTSLIAGIEGRHCKKNFHKVCGYSHLIDSVEQVTCNTTTLCDNYKTVDDCRSNCQDKLELNLKNVFEIAPYAFRSNFTRLRLTSGSDDCDRKRILFSPLSFYGLSDVLYLELDCIEFTMVLNPFRPLESLEELTLSRIGSTQLLEFAFSDFPGLIRLNIRKIDIGVLTAKNTSHINRDLQALSLKDNKLTAIDGKSFERFHKLERLEISGSNIRDLQPDVFYGLNELTLLNLSGNKITVLRRNAFSKLRKLTELNLGDNKICEIEAEAFADLPIKTLYLDRNQLVNWAAGAFKNLDNLSILNLDRNQIRSLSKNAFEGLENNKLYLSLRNNDIHHLEPSTFQGFNDVSLTFSELIPGIDSYRCIKSVRITVLGVFDSLTDWPPCQGMES